MKQAGKRFSLPSGVVWGISLAALSCAALLSGCKGNTTAAAVVDRKVGKPPRIVAQRTTQDSTYIDPSTNPAWDAAAWQTLVAPINNAHMPPPTRTALCFDDANLYVAVICDRSTDDGRDAVALYLDPMGQGVEMLQVTISAEGKTQCTWIRAGGTELPLEDGSPDLAHPLDLRPLTSSGIGAKVFQDAGGWRVMVKVPAAGIPLPMRAPLGANSWRFNVLRTVGQEQSNLAPVYLNSQAESAYRMAYLDFAAQK